MRYSCRHSLPSFPALRSALPAVPAAAQPEIFPIFGVNWTVDPAFGQAGEGRTNVSGATCMDAVVARPACLVVNDSTRFAQFFTVSGHHDPVRRLWSASRARRRRARSTGNPNMEGAANDDRFFYVVTSRDRPSIPTAAARHRFPRRPLSSRHHQPPPAPPGTVPGLQISDRFRTALTAGIPVPGLPNQKIDRDQSDIQGIAITPGATRGIGVVNLGFRTPASAASAFILRAHGGSVFATSGGLHADRHVASRSASTSGIRDLAAVHDGILILAATARAAAPSLFLL